MKPRESNVGAAGVFVKNMLTLNFPLDETLG